MDEWKRIQDGDYYAQREAKGWTGGGNKVYVKVQAFTNGSFMYT